MTLSHRRRRSRTRPPCQSLGRGGGGDVVDLLLLLFYLAGSARDTTNSLYRKSNLTTAEHCGVLQGPGCVETETTAVVLCLCWRSNESCITASSPAGIRAMFLELFRPVTRRDRSVRSEVSPARSCDIQGGWGAGGGVLISCIAVDPSIPTRPRRRTSGF